MGTATLIRPVASWTRSLDGAVGPSSALTVRTAPSATAAARATAVITYGRMDPALRAGGRLFRGVAYQPVQLVGERLRGRPAPLPVRLHGPQDSALYVARHPGAQLVGAQVLAGRRLLSYR